MIKRTMAINKKVVAEATEAKRLREEPADLMNAPADENHSEKEGRRTGLVQLL